MCYNIHPSVTKMNEQSVMALVINDMKKSLEMLPNIPFKFDLKDFIKESEKKYIDEDFKNLID